MPLTLNPFVAEEIKEIYRLMEDIYSTSDTMCEQFPEKFPNENSCHRYFSEILSQPGSVVFFARIDGILAGYITIKQRIQGNLRHTSELNMGVHSKFRSQGIGKFLLINALEVLKKAGIIEIIYLVTRDDNTPAIKLYKNFGFEKIAHLSKDTKIGEKYYDGIMMRKSV
jgi:ribosomal protein S18 acetylase RimI-like enzyme